MYIFTCEICVTQISFLRRTTAIHGGIDTLRIICSGVYSLIRKPFEIDDTDARSAQKTPAGVLAVRRGLFFVKRQRRCVVYFKRCGGRHIV